MSGFRDLNVYIAARDLVVKIYTLLKKFPDDERFAMCSQLRRSSVSITSNIASVPLSSVSGDSKVEGLVRGTDN